MVVSEIGEQWSPQTAPAIQAEMQMMAMGLLMSNTLCTMGIRMPKVPQLVPVAKASRQPTANTITGRNICSPEAVRTKSRTKYFAPRESVIPFRDQAKVRMRMAGTMALNPSGMQPIISRKDMDLRTK